MGIIFDQEIAEQMKLNLALNPFPTQKELVQMRDEAINEYNTNYLAVHPEIKLVNQNNSLTSVSQNQIQNLISSLIPETKPNTTYTIRKVFDAMLLKGNNKKACQVRKRNAFELMLKGVGLTWDDDYFKFHNVDLIERMSRNILAMNEVHNEGKRVRLGYIKEVVNCACNMEPFYKTNVIANLPNIPKSKKFLLKPHIPYSQDQLLNIFDPKHDFFKENPDCFWLCMIGLFTGARANAAMTLQYQDLIDENGLACVYFRSNHPVKNLKNEASERKVPIHKQLLDLGFVDYVKRKQKILNAKGEDFILSKAVTKSGQYNNKYMDRVLFPFLKDIGVKGCAHDSYDFHSFRKNANQAMRKAIVDTSFVNDVIGWSGKGTAEQSYCNHTLAQIKEQLDTFEYDFLKPHFDRWKVIMAEKP